METILQETADTVCHNERIASWVSQHGGAVRGYLRGVVGRGDLIDDLFQEVFFRAWQARKRYEERGFSRAYLLQIADRVARGRIRKTKPELTLSDEAWAAAEPHSFDADPAAQAAQTETSRRLDAALAQLTDIQRRALLLRYFGQLTFNEIAATLDCPLNTALSHCHRGLQILRKHFESDKP